MDDPELKQTVLSIYPSLKAESLEALLDFCEYKQMGKHTELLSEGKHHPYSYLLLSGGAKSYYLKDAKEVCIWFAFEHDFIGSIATYYGLPSQETVVLLEDSDLIQLHLPNLKALAKADLSISQLFNELLLEHAMFTEEKLRQLQFMTAQERYQALIEQEPSILQRVSLTDIASYLGVSRETLSRIRALR